MSPVRWRGPATSRRAFLGAAAATVALPFLPSLLPRTARADSTAPVRLLWWFCPNGMHMPAWRPTQEGTGYSLPPILASLAPVQDRVTVLRGVDTYVGPPGNTTPPHIVGAGGFLTAVCAVTGPMRLGRSVDQIAARQIGGQTLFPSVQLGTEGSRGMGNCDAGYSCEYNQNLSWADPVTPLHEIVSARVAFDRLFEGGDVTATAEERARRYAQRRSVLDHVVGEASSLRSSLGTLDRERLDRYLTSVRELELRLERTEDSVRCEVGSDVPVDETNPTELIDRMSEIMALAYACDMTRVITFASANGGSRRSHDFLGVPGAHHDMSHHGGDAVKQAMLQQIDTWEIERFAYALSLFDAHDEGDGTTLLDNMFVMLGSEVADGNAHELTDLPVLVAGGGGGHLVSGRALTLDHRALLDVHLTGLHLAGVDTAPWANGTGPITELLT